MWQFLNILLQDQNRIIYHLASEKPVSIDVLSTDSITLPMYRGCVFVAVPAKTSQEVEHCALNMNVSHFFCLDSNLWITFQDVRMVEQYFFKYSSSQLEGILSLLKFKCSSLFFKTDSYKAVSFDSGVEVNTKALKQSEVVSKDQLSFFNSLGLSEVIWFYLYCY